MVTFLWEKLFRGPTYSKITLLHPVQKLFASNSLVEKSLLIKFKDYFKRIYQKGSSYMQNYHNCRFLQKRNSINTAHIALKNLLCLLHSKWKKAYAKRKMSCWRKKTCFFWECASHRYYIQYLGPSVTQQMHSFRCMRSGDDWFLLAKTKKSAKSSSCKREVLRFSAFWEISKRTLKKFPSVLILGLNQRTLKKEILFQSA